MKKPKPAIKPEIKWAIWNPTTGFFNGTYDTRKAAIEGYCSGGYVWSICKKHYGDRAVKVEIREAK